MKKAQKRSIGLLTMQAYQRCKKSCIVGLAKDKVASIANPRF